MNKKQLGLGIVAMATLVGASEFTKKSTRKDKAQQDSAYADCVQLIDSLIAESCKVQSQLADLTGKLYKKLRSCAIDEKSELAERDTTALRKAEQVLKALGNQLQELEKAISVVEKAV